MSDTEKQNLGFNTIKDQVKDSLNKLGTLSGKEKVKLGAAITQNLGASLAKIGNKDGLSTVNYKNLTISNGSKKEPNVTSEEKKVIEDFGKSEAPTAPEAGETSSDERLKRIFGENEDIIKCFGRINAIDFEYNDTAKELYGDSHGVDDEEHIGVKAQELKSNPVTEGAVKTDEETGFLTVDTRQLCLTNTAVLGEVCRRLDALESMIKFLKG